MENLTIVLLKKIRIYFNRDCSGGKWREQPTNADDLVMSKDESWQPEDRNQSENDDKNTDKENPPVPTTASGVQQGTSTHGNSQQGRTNTQDVRARYWRLLFDNLKRAVGDIYSMCEHDGDIAECKEAIMVLHNRIKEFEGLIQYIEVQTTYETSEERPSSVAWQVPVSAIKQPTLPYQQNGDPGQLYYYPNYMQTYQPYSVPGTFPMVDINFLPYNQPGAFPTFPTEFIPPTPPPPQSNQYPPWHKFENHQYHHSGAHKNERRKNNDRRNKNDSNYNKRKNDYQNNHKSVPPGPKPQISSSECNGKIDPKLVSLPNDGVIENTQSISTAVKLDVIDTSQNLVQPSLDLPVTVSQIIKPQETDVEKLPETLVKLSPEVVESIQDNKESPIEIQQSSIESTEQSVTEDHGPPLKDNIEHSQGEPPQEINDINTTDIHSKLAEAIDDKSDDIIAETSKCFDDDTVIPMKKSESADWQLLEKSGSKDGYIHVNSEGSDHSVAASPDNMMKSRSNTSIGEDKPAGSSDEHTGEHMEEIVKADIVCSLNEDNEVTEKELAIVIDDPSTDPADKIESNDSEKEETALTSDERKELSDILPNIEQKTDSVAVEVNTDVFHEKDQIPECDALSESGMSTMSSGSVKSSISLPANPLMRSTSWADLVRKGKSESPPAVVNKRAGATRYNSTPSRYLSHTTQKQGPASRTAPKMTSRTIRSTPPITLRNTSRSTTKPPFVTNPGSNTKDPKNENEKTEDGWKVSSGRSRVKILSKSTPPLPIKAIDSTKTIKSPQSSPRLILKSANKDSKSPETSSTTKKIVLKRPARISASSSATKSTVVKVRKSTITKATTSSASKAPLKAKSKENLSSSSDKDLLKPFVVKVKSTTLSKKTSRSSETLDRKSKTASKSSDKKDAPKVRKTSETIEEITKNVEENKEEEDVKVELSEEKQDTPEEKQDKPEEIVETDEKVQEVEEKNREVEQEEKEENADESEEDKMMDKEKTIVNDVVMSSKGIQINLQCDTAADPSKNGVGSSPVTPVLMSPVGPVAISHVTKVTVATSTYPDEEMYNEMFFRPAYPLPGESDDDRCGVLRVMLSRKRQISDGSSMSGGTADEEERICSSPGRSPGKAPQLHQRLSSPSRRRNATDTLRLHNERLAKAQLQRDKIQEEKAIKLKKIKIKEEQVKDLQEQQEKERIMRGIEHAEKLQRAENLRLEKILEIKKRAHEEEHKVNEIAFINTMEAENRKMELMSKEQMAESKQKELQEERRKKVCEQQAREGAVMERKQNIEAERLARIALLEDKRKETLAKVNLIKLEKEHAREEAAKEKARERERKIESAHVDKSELEQRILQKHKEHKERQLRQLEIIRERAAIMCVGTISEFSPEHALYDTPRWCTLCSVKIISEAFLVSHMNNCHKKSSKKEAEIESQYIVDYTEDLSPYSTDILTRQKMLRKRTKKVKTRLTNRLNEIPQHVLPEKPRDCSNKNRILKCIKAISTVKGLEKGISDLNRTTLTPEDYNHLLDRGVVDQIGSVLLSPDKSRLLLPVSKLLFGFAGHSSEGSSCCMRHMTVIIDELSQRLTTPDSCTIALLDLTTILVKALKPGDGLTTEVISYLVSKYIIDSIQSLCLNITQLKDEMLVSLLVSTLQLVSASCDVVMTTQQLTLMPHKCEMSQLGESLLSTDLCGVVTLLYGVLLYDGPRRKSTPPALTQMTQDVTSAALSMLLSVAKFNLYTLQNILDKDPISQEIRHVCSYLLWSASYHSYTTILDHCIELIGYSTFSHPKNQLLLQNGPSPTILQLLCALPLNYFSAPESMDLLFPTLISACHNSPSNLTILQQKVNKIMLVGYIKEKLELRQDHIRMFPVKHFKEALLFLESNS